MDAGDLSSHEDITFQQQRTKLVLAVLGAVGFAALGASFALHPDAWQSHRHSAATMQVSGWVGLAFFSIALCAALIAIARPTTVRLSPQGLVVTTAWRTFTRPWDALGNFRIWKNRGASTVVFDDVNPPSAWLARLNRAACGATSALPKFLGVEPEGLLAAVLHAKARWGQPAPPPASP